MVKIGSHLLEIINKNIDFQKNYIEFELLDTNFANFAKYISPIAINVENEVTGAELSTVALVELLQELSEINLKLKLYEDEITAYAATINQTITFERLEYPDFSEMVEAEKVANYEVLKWFVERTLDIRKRIIIIRKVLRDMATLQLMKDYSNYARATIIHPSLTIACFITGGIDTVTSQGGSPPDFEHNISAMVAEFWTLDDAYEKSVKIGEIELYPSENYINHNSTTEATGVPLCVFSSLGDVFVVNNKIYDFTEYGLALSPNWQGVTLDIIESRG